MTTPVHAASPTCDSTSRDWVSLFDCLLDPLLLISADDGTILRCNAAARRWLNCQADALIGQPFCTLFSEPEVARREDLLARVRVHGHVFAEQVFRSRDGRNLRADLSASLCHWAGHDVFAVHLRDAELRIAAHRLEYDLREATAREQTVAHLNHEINNPLQALMLRTDADESIRHHATQIARVLQKLREALGEGIASRTTSGSDAAPPPPPPAVKAADRRRILVVDDYETIRRSLSLMLRSRIPGVQVDLAADGEEAVACFRQAHPAVMVLDIQLPKKTGDEVFTEIQAICHQQNWEEPHIIFCTGYTPPATVRQAVEQPGSPHLCLLKPVPAMELVNTILAQVTALEATAS